MAGKKAKKAQSGTGGTQGASSAPAFIRVENGFYAGLEWPIGADPVVVGRGRKADLTLAEPTISRTHLRVGRQEAGFFLEDLGSTNGTQRNGKRVSRSDVCDGDELRLGKLALRLKLTGEQA